MLTLASWYQRENWRGRPMRISYTAGRAPGLKKSVFNWGVVRCLIPDWSLVKAYRSGSISQEQYIPAYTEQLATRWSEVAAWLSSLKADENLTLLCHEREGEFCHRQLVAALVRNHRPDIEVTLR